MCVFFFKQKTAYEMRISDWSSDVCSSDLEAIWNTVEGEVGKFCASCHGDAAESMAEVSATYPKWDAEAKRPVNVELQINDCRENNMKAAPYKFDAPEQKALTTNIKQIGRAHV